MKKTKRFCRQGCTALIAAGVFLASCMPEDDFQDIEIMAPSPSLSLPILNTSLKVSDLIRTEEGGLLEENPDGSYSLFYRQSIQTPTVSEFFPELPEQQFQESYSLGYSTPSFWFSPPPITYEGTIGLDLEGLSIYGIECKEGNLNISLNSDYDHDIRIALTLNDVLDANNRPLTLEFEMYNWGTRNVSEFVDLSGYYLDIDNNELSYSAEVSIVGSGQPIDANDEVSLNFSLSDLAFSYLEGNFSNVSIPLDADTLDIPMLANAINGNVALNPNLTIDIQNSFGVPISPDLSNIYVRRSSGTVVRLQDEGESNFFSGEFVLPFQKDRDELPAMLSQQINRDNSNLEEAFAELPRGIAYLLGFELSSSAEDTSFITENSSISIDMEVEVPLEASFDITLQDTLALDLGKDQDIEQLKLLIKTENDFPIDAQLQVYFLDESGEMIYGSDNEPLRAFEEQAQLLKAAQIINSSTGETQSVSIDMPISATLDAEKVDLIQNAGSILVQAKLQSNSEDDNMIKLYSSYGIRFSLAMQIQSSINVSN
jgi:hypothetical protein